MDSSEEDSLVGVPTRLRIISLFAMWFEELERVLYSNTTEAVKCLHHVSRILEDALIVGESGSNLIEEDRESIVDKLIEMVSGDFVDITESAFQFVVSTTDINYYRAMTRFMVAYKRCCKTSFDLFYSVFTMEQLEGLLSEYSQITDPLFVARLAYLAGELFDDNDSSIPNEAINQANKFIAQIKDSAAVINSRKEELEPLTEQILQNAEYFNNSDVPLPFPTQPIAGWEIDLAENVNSIAHHVMLLTGHLRIVGSIGDTMELLPLIIEANLVELCLQLFHLPQLDIHYCALNFFTCSLGHKKIALEFVDKQGLSALYSLSNYYTNHLDAFGNITPLLSFILVAISKHPHAMELLVQDEGIALRLLSFACALMMINSFDTHLNIIEFFGEAFAHPYLLTVVPQTECLPLVMKFLQFTFVDTNYIRTTGEKTSMLQQTIRRESIRTLLKYLERHLYWSVQYTKLVQGQEEFFGQAKKYTTTQQPAQDESTTNNVNQAVPADPVNKQINFSPLKLSSSGKLLKTFTDDPQSTTETSRASAASVLANPNDLTWIGGNPMMIRIDEYELQQLEFFVLQQWIAHGQLPIGMTIDMFHIQSLLNPPPDHYNHHKQNDTTLSSSSSALPAAAHPMMHVEDDLMSYTSQYTSLTHQPVLPTLQPEWMIAKLYLQMNVIPTLLQVLSLENKDTITMTSSLLILELLALDSACIQEIQRAVPHVALNTSSSSATSTAAAVSETTANAEENVTSAGATTQQPHTSTTQGQGAGQSQGHGQGEGEGKKKGIEILLHTISGAARRDPSIIIASLRVLSAMCTPPYFRYKGSNPTTISELIEQFTSTYHATTSGATAGGGVNTNTMTHTNTNMNMNGLLNTPAPPGSAMKKIKPDGTTTVTATATKKVTVTTVVSALRGSMLERVQQQIRRQIRQYSGINAIIPLIYYKKNQLFFMTIRIETIRVLLGLVQDNDIKLILFKMRISNMFENQLHVENHLLSTQLDYNTGSSGIGGGGGAGMMMMNHHTPSIRSNEKMVLSLYCHIFTQLVQSIVHGNKDIDAMQDAVDRKTIVEHSHIEFSEQELMQLIKEHLLAKGLSRTVAMLGEELSEDTSTQPQSLHEHHHHHSHSNTTHTTQGISSCCAMSSATHTAAATSVSKPTPMTTTMTPMTGVLPPRTPHRQPESTLTRDSTTATTGTTTSASATATSVNTNNKKRSRAWSLSESNHTTATTTKPMDTDGFDVVKKAKSDIPVTGTPIPTSTLPAVPTTTNSHPTPTLPMTPPKETIPTSSSSSSSMMTTSKQTILVRYSPLPVHLPIAKSQRKKNIIRAIHHNTATTTTTTTSTTTSTTGATGGKGTSSTPIPSSTHKPKPTTTTNTTTTTSTTTITTTNPHPRNIPVPSKLTHIMHRYLKLQHSLCKHPITTLPLLSLLKPHTCTTTTTTSPYRYTSTNNIHALLTRQHCFAHGTRWYDSLYAPEYTDSVSRYFFSAYRPLRTVREIEPGSMISATAFAYDSYGQTSGKLWIAYHEDWQSDGPGMALLDMITGQETIMGGGGMDFPGVIGRILSSPRSYDRPSQHTPFILTAVTDYEHRHSFHDHDLYLWKDTTSTASNATSNTSHTTSGGVGSGVGGVGSAGAGVRTGMGMDTFESPYVHHLTAYASTGLHYTNEGSGGGGGSGGETPVAFHHEVFDGCGEQVAALSIGRDTQYAYQRSTAYLFDLHTGSVYQSIRNSEEDTYNTPTVQYIPVFNPDDPSSKILCMDGKLYDLRIPTSGSGITGSSGTGNSGGCIHRFDKLSTYGNTSIHPYHPYELIIDHTIWDLRMMQLQQTIPLFENCALQFDPFHHVGIAYRSNLWDEATRGQHDGFHEQAFQSFHVFSLSNYAHLHTEYLEKEHLLLHDLSISSYGSGYLNTLLVSNDFSEAVCRVFTIGKRRGGMDGGDSDGDEEEDDEDWHHGEDDDEEDEDDMLEDHGDDDDDDEIGEDDEYSIDEEDSAEDEEDDDEDEEDISYASEEDEEEEDGADYDEEVGADGVGGRGRLRASTEDLNDLGWETVSEDE